MKKEKKKASGAATLLYYAPGGGLGQLTRAVAILRQWKRHTGRSSLLLTYSRFAHLAKRLGVAVRQISGPDPSLIKRVLSQARPKMLVVDTFPRGIVGELADLMPGTGCPAVLVQHYLNPLYLRQFNVAAFIAQYYRLVVRIADSMAPQTLSQRTVDVPPVTVREARELRHAEGRSGWLFLEWEGSEPYVAVASEVAQRLGKTLRVIKPNDVFPAVDLMLKAELVIASGGYNVFHETALAGVPAIFVPGRRMYDDQFARTVNAAQARTPEALKAVLEVPLPAPLLPHSGEGAAAAAGIIQALLTGLEGPAKTKAKPKPKAKTKPKPKPRPKPKPKPRPKPKPKTRPRRKATTKARRARSSRRRS